MPRDKYGQLEMRLVPQRNARTPVGLNEGLPIQIVREKFHRKQYFFHKKDSRFDSLIIHKNVFFSLDKYQSLKIWVEISVFAI